MADLPTRLDLRDLGRSYLLDINVQRKRNKWEPALIDTDGADLSLAVGAASEVAFACVKQLGIKSGNVFLDACDGQDLDRWGYDHYQQPRKSTYAAVGFARIYRFATSVTPAVVTPPAPTTVSTSTTSVTSSITLSGLVADTVTTRSDSSATVTTNPDGSSRQDQTLATTQTTGAGTTAVAGNTSVATTAPPVVGTPDTPEIVTINALPAGTIELGTRLIAFDGSQYQTTEVVSFAEGETEIFVRIQATQPGKIYQQGANQIQRFASNEGLFDQQLLITNPDPTAGGEPDEADDPYRERLRRFWNAARRSTPRALVYGAITVPGVVSATAVEFDPPDFDYPLLLGDSPDAEVQVNLTVADSSGIGNEALDDDVGTAMIDYRAGGIHVVASAGQPQLVSITLRLTFLAGIDTTTLVFQIRNAVVELVNGLDVNETLRLSELAHLLVGYSTAGLVVDDSSVVAPTVDLVPDAGHTLRIRVDDVLLA